MKTLFILIAVLLFSALSAQSQTINESYVLSAGGGFSTANTTTNFVVLGEPFVSSSLTNASTNTLIGFIYRTNDLQATLINLTIFLEGLYGGAGTMYKAQNAAGDQYSGTIADKFTFELHNALNYASTAFSNTNVDLNTNGTSSLSVPSNINGSYYITLKHRNSLEVISASPVTIAGTTINYNFSNAQSQAYGNRLKLLGEGVYGLYAGDVDGNGAINLSDITGINNAANVFAEGYIPSDVNGDGTVDAIDLILADNNAALSISNSTP